MQLQEQVIQGFRLSPQQKRLWHLQQNSLAYLVQGAILLEGNLNQEVLELALQQIIQQHEILHTNFRRPQGVKTPIQVISDNSIPLWNKVNLNHWKTQEQAVKIVDISQGERLKVFDFEQSSLVRANLLTLSNHKHILLLTLPALCADNQSLVNLVQQISHIYSASLVGKNLSNNDVNVQYIQFSEWQNQIIEEDTEGKEFWQQQLSTTTTELKLPFEIKLADSVSFAVNTIESRIDSQLLDKIVALTEKNNVTLSTFFLTCWQVLLWRLTGKDVVIGVGCDGRQYEELATAIGLFAKYLPLNCLLQTDYHFSELLQQVDKATQDIYQWQEYFSWDLEESELLPFGFNFITQPETYSSDDLAFSLIHQYVCFEQFKIKLFCTQQADDLIATFEYDANLVNAEYIQLLAQYFHTIVENAIAYPEIPISQLQILNQRQQQQLLFEFNNNQAKFPRYSYIHQLFEQQVERTPDNIAVVFKDKQLTYTQLNQKANQLAHYLEKQGVKPEVVVGICVDHSLESIIGILAILKAGGAYLPLDSALPSANLNFRLQDAKAPILLTQQHLSEKLLHCPTKIICLDTNWQEIAQQNTTNLSSNITPENLAYIIYTSGSTGTPKGVAVEHQQLLNYVQAIRISLDLPSNASWGLVSTFAADLGNTAIFSALSTGGCLHILSSEQTTDAEAMADYCRRYPIDCLKIVPSHLKALLTAAETTSILPRHRLILGGETVDWNLVEQIRHLAPQCLIFNHYGPTEATIGALTYAVETTNNYAQTVPLGKAIANTQVYLLDEHLQLVPIGVKGELYIGGAGVARGYLNQPELTTEKFIQNPFSNTYSRLYKTGDLARYLPDGNIEFLGRIDDQVKLRGYRVELGEISTLLTQHPAVQQAVILVRDSLGDRSLVAYVVPHLAEIPNASELKNFLQEQLPEYMIPAAFVFLKALPLTSNGKVDRQALPLPNQSLVAATFISPRTPLEADIATIWQNLLHLKQISIHDNFFDLGGHSLLLTQLLAKVRVTFQVELPLLSLFATPTIAGLAESIETAGRKQPTFLDLNAEAVLDPSIQPYTLPQQIITAPRAIFLTGATGFLGAFLLYELLHQTEANIYCLVRARDIESAQQKIRDSLESYGIWDTASSDRIIPIIGELSQPLLGLSKQQFQQLASEIDTIYHNGAFVNFTLPYTALKAANVLGTQEVLRLASHTKLKPVHFISSTSVAVPADTSNVQVIQEQDCPAADQVLDGGYPQTKWVAEKLVKIAGDRGLPVSIYRPGRISWHSKTGVCNPEDHTSRMIKGCIQLGIAPDLDALINLAPVDYVSQAIVHLSKQSSGKTFHIVNHQLAHWNQFVNNIRSFGYSIESASEVKWQEQLLQVAQSSPDNALYPLVPLLIKQVSEEPLSHSSVLHFDCQNTLTGLTESAIACPPVDIKLLTPYFSYLLQHGFLNAASNND